MVLEIEYTNFCAVLQKGTPAEVHDAKEKLFLLIKMALNNNALCCFIDGNSLSVVRGDFENLQESPAYFILLTNQQQYEIEHMFTDENIKKVNEKKERLRVKYQGDGH